MWLMWLEKAKEVKAKGTQRLYESNRSNWVYAQLSDQRHRAAESMDGQRNTRISKSSHCAVSLLLGWLISLKQPSSTRFSSKACWGIPKCLSVWYGFWNPKHPLQPELLEVVLLMGGGEGFGRLNDVWVWEREAQSRTLLRWILEDLGICTEYPGILKDFRCNVWSFKFCWGCVCNWRYLDRHRLCCCVSPKANKPRAYNKSVNLCQSWFKPSLAA